MLYEKGMQVTIPLFIKLNLTPNQITVLRLLILIPPAAFLFTLGNYFASIVALALFHIFTFLDIVDGKIATIRGMRTKLGEIIDPPIDYIGHDLIFVGIIIGVLSSGGVFRVAFYPISIPVQLLLACGLLTIVGYSVPIIFSAIPPTRFFMFQDLHDLHEDFFPENGIKSDYESRGVWLCKNIICHYNFPFNIVFKVGPLLTVFTLLGTLFIPLIIFSITLNIRTLTLFYYFYKVHRKQNLPRPLEISTATDV